jgi:hypothetical protein
MVVLLGGSTWASAESGHTTYRVSRQHTQVTTEIRADSEALAHRHLAAMALHLRDLPMVTSVRGAVGTLLVRLDPPAPVEIHLEQVRDAVRVRAEFLGRAPGEKPGTYLAKLAGMMKTINERLVAQAQ